MNQMTNSKMGLENGLARKVIEHWENVFANTPTIEEPFDHFYIDGIWPDDVYPRLLEMLPPKSHYVPINLKRWVRSDGTSTRDRIVLSQENIDKLDNNLREFWNQISLAITSESMKRLVFSKLKNDLSLRLNVPSHNVVDQEVFVGGTLTCDTEEYRIKPHPDGYPRIVTMQFYLPESEDQIDLGTSLYVREPYYRRILGNKFREVKRLPYKANSGYAFAVNDLPNRISLHGRELIEANAGDRNSILFSWYAEKTNSQKSSAVAVIPTNKEL